MRLIGPAHSSQFIEWHNSGITTLKHAVCAPNVFWNLPENQITTNFIYLTSSNLVTISHINYRDQVNSWKNLWKFWNGPLCRNKSATSLLLNVAAYRKNRNTEACAKNLSQILANNTDNGEKGIGFRIYVRCSSWQNILRSLYCYQCFQVVKIFVENGVKTSVTGSLNIIKRRYYFMVYIRDYYLV